MSAKQSEVMLALNQNADANTCGSCHYFDRRDAGSEWDHNGHCTFRLPPTREFERHIWDGESQTPDTVQDTDRCDLWKSSGKTYIVSRRVKP